MYTVLLAVKSPILLQELKRLRIWGESTGFRIAEVTADFENLIEKLRETKYHLVQSFPERGSSAAVERYLGGRRKHTEGYR